MPSTYWASRGRLQAPFRLLQRECQVDHCGAIYPSWVGDPVAKKLRLHSRRRRPRCELDDALRDSERVSDEDDEGVADEDDEGVSDEVLLADRTQ